MPLSGERVLVLKGKSVSSIIDLLKSSERPPLPFLSKRNNGIRWRLKKENLISSFVKLATGFLFSPMEAIAVVKKIAAFVAISRNNKIYCFECFQSEARSETSGMLFPFATKALI